MNDILRYTRILTALIVLLGGGAVIALYVSFPENTTYPAGMALGVLIGLVAFRLLVNSTIRAVRNPDSVTPSSAVKSNMTTTGLRIAALVIAVLNPGIFSAWTALVGLLIPQGIMILEHIIRPAELATATTSPSPATAAPTSVSAETTEGTSHEA